MINEFRGRYAFLSNFYRAPFVYRAVEWSTVEHAYQAAKTSNSYWIARVREAHTPREAKEVGGMVPLDSDWDERKLLIMEELVRRKFRQNPDLRLKLLATKSHYLEEGNQWGDTFWGVCNGYGLNHLGMILMRIRDELEDD